MTRKLLLVAALIVGAAACSMIPRYTRPAPPVPAEWPSGPSYRTAAGGLDGEAAARIDWRDFYGDEQLQKVIDLALANNRDLRIVAANVERARALYAIQEAQLLPIVGASGSYSEQRVPVDVSQIGEAMTVRQYQVNLGVTAWELDFFGRIRSLKESALAQYLATEQARLSTQISLVAAVANTWLARAADNEGLRLARSTLKARESSLDLVKRRFDVGASSSLDFRQAQTLTEAARVDVIGFTRRVALDENALNLLVGATIPAELLAGELQEITPFREVSPGLSSEVLLGRPDVVQSEDLLKAANANIGAARAAFFPRIALTTSIGTISTELSGLFGAGAASWLFVPQVSLPIFDSRTRPAYEVAKVEREISLAQYEKTIQVAFREVADALAESGTLGDQVAAQQSLVDAATEAYRLSNARYTRGIDNYLVVLDAQRSLYAAQQGLINLRAARLSNLVTLYKVLGGGM
jgi:outer membrane protein, multidrug efflux system